MSEKGLKISIEPVGIAVRGEQVYVCDTGNQRVQVFSLRGEWLFEFIPYGWGGHTQSIEPHLSVDEQGNIYLTDSTRGRLEIFSPKGDPIRKCFTGLSRPTGVDAFGDRCAVAETTANRVRIFKSN